MHSDERRTTALVEAARAGDAEARDALVRAYLPLVHNIVGRALDGHADTDDIVQETMVRALDGLTGLRDPDRFRSWLVAIAMNGIRRRWRERQQAPVPGLDRAADLADPAAGDFTEVTILRLGLSGQRRDVARATRWLDEDDRELLALWWLEAAGELTRAELAEGLGGLSPQHAAVRVQRMKERLETGRAVVRALDAVPRCQDLAETVTTWDGRPSPLWRKRVARHLRGCDTCTARVNGRSGLAPVEGLLVGIGLVPPLAITAAHGHATESVGYGTVSRWTPLRRVGVAGAAAVAVLGAVALLVPQEQPHARVAPDRPAAAPAPTTATPAPAVTTASPTPTTASPTPRRTTRPAPTPTPAAEERVTGLVNRLRAKAGCAPLRIDPRLTEAARGYARDMVARGYFGHASPEGEYADARITAAGYAWSAWAENLDRGTADPAGVVDDWTDGSMHERNMLDCRYRDTGVASAPGPGGRVWVQKLAAPAS
ncbi:sigma-70 family RNA polymerase sigma factor [Streptomyces venezuelae]|uniref:sigma-70 family RNA polymerase sigma factor n=1 Tax=Streptomyces venezuelae TaxID=54571 RepID=UPI0037D639F5